MAGCYHKKLEDKLKVILSNTTCCDDNHSENIDTTGNKASVCHKFKDHNGYQYEFGYHNFHGYVFIDI